MEERVLGEAIEQKRFFDTAPAPSLPEQDEGKRDMGPLYPFLISGGKIQSVGISPTSMT